MNGIWGGMLLVGIIYGVMTGRTEAVSAAVLDSSRDAVTLCITMLGITGLWMGLMQIAQDGGAVSVISAKNETADPVSVSGNPGESFGIRCDHLKFCREFSRPWVGSDSGRTSGDEGAGGAAGTKRRGGRNGERRNVCISDPEYFVAAADPGHGNCIPEPVPQRGSGSYHGTCDRGDSGKHCGGCTFCKMGRPEKEKDVRKRLLGIRGSGQF